MGYRLPFRNRDEAAEYLLQALKTYRGQDPLILAIPRGAVPMAARIAAGLGGEANVVLVRKLRAPHQPELAIGAIDESGQYFLNHYAQGLSVDEEYLEREKQLQMKVLRERRELYTPARPQVDPRERIVIVVDDGIATGSTMMAALRALRSKSPKRLIAATAIAPSDTLARLRPYADEIVCLETPLNFQAVGQFFEDFSQVSDEEVVHLLRESRQSA